MNAFTIFFLGWGFADCAVALASLRKHSPFSLVRKKLIELEKLLARFELFLTLYLLPYS